MDVSAFRVLTETSNPGHAADNLAGGIGRMPDEKTRQRMREVFRNLPRRLLVVRSFV